MGRLRHYCYCSGHPTALTRAFDSSKATESEDYSINATAAKLADASIVAVRIAGIASSASFNSAAAAIASTFASSFAAIATVVATTFTRHFTGKLGQQLD